jgi:hypothetical protein
MVYARCAIRASASAPRIKKHIIENFFRTEKQGDGASTAPAFLAELVKGSVERYVGRIGLDRKGRGDRVLH